MKMVYAVKITSKIMMLHFMIGLILVGSLFFRTRIRIIIEGIKNFYKNYNIATKELKRIKIIKIFQTSKNR